MTSEVPSSAWSRRRQGSPCTTRNTSQVSNDAPSAADKMPSFASARVSPDNASEAISSETVNPIPATAPTPVTAPHPTGGVTRPRVSRASSHAMPHVPIGLPTRYPIRIPSVTGEV